MDTLLLRLQTLFQDVFDDPALLITARTTASDVPGWDSLTTINLVVAMEKEFNISFALGEIQELGNVGEMAAVIQRKAGVKA